MRIGKSNNTLFHVQIEAIDGVEEFCYSGCVATEDGGSNSDNQQDP